LARTTYSCSAISIAPPPVAPLARRSASPTSASVTP
jgi:hypothetical protein